MANVFRYFIRKKDKYSRLRYMHFYSDLGVILFLFMQNAVTLSNTTALCKQDVVFPIIKGIRIKSVYGFDSAIARTAHECGELCLRRNVCRSATFLPGKYICHFNAVVNSSNTGIEDVNAEYVESDAVQLVRTILSETRLCEFISYMYILYPCVVIGNNVIVSAGREAYLYSVCSFDCTAVMENWKVWS